MGWLNRDAIRAVDDRAAVEVDVPEWGGVIGLRRLSAAEAQAFAKLDESQRQDALVRLVIMSAVDQDGRRLFDDSDASWLVEKSFASLVRIQRAAVELNGLSDLAVTDAKNA